MVRPLMTKAHGQVLVWREYCTHGCIGQRQIFSISNGYCFCDLSGCQLSSTICTWAHRSNNRANIICMSPIMQENICWALFIQVPPTCFLVLMWYEGKLIKMLLGSSQNEFLSFIQALNSDSE